MAKLTANQESFIQMMTKSEEHARRGFELLIARKGFENFFDFLRNAGLFDPARNPMIAPADEPGYFRVPYWDALDYLEAVARLSGENNDLELAQKVMDVVRNVSKSQENLRDNHHTSRKFADILGLVPTSVVTMDDINLLPGWLATRFDRGMAAHSLDKGALRRLVESDKAEDWEKACRILHHCTAISWRKQQGFDKERLEPVSIVEDYWLKELVKNHASTLGAKAGAKAAGVFVERLREVFNGDRKQTTWIWRPAIEDHEQNHAFYDLENVLIEGLRDTVLSWTNHYPAAAKPFVEALLRDEAEVLWRIGIHVLSAKWSVFKDLYQHVVDTQFFNSNHLHEVHVLLRDHFLDFTEAEKQKTVETLHQLPSPASGEDRERRLKRIQHNWLLAMAGKGYGPVDKWFAELNADLKIEGTPSHPDFHSFMTTGSGFGPTPYEVEELVAFAEEGSIVDKLNSFVPSSEWRGPSTESLVQALEAAVQQQPRTFLALLPAFIAAKRPYQYGIIKGFKTLWESTDKQYDLDWNEAWNGLLSLFEELLFAEVFWGEGVESTGGMAPTRDWIPPLIADFLQAGTQKDEKAYPPQFLPRGWKLIQILLEKSEAVGEPKDDAMFQAINSSKGKAVEALFNHALRACRLSDREKGEHAAVWTELRPVFEAELAKCKNLNYEFSTLAGSCILNLMYMDGEWLRSRMKQIFPIEFKNNCIGAIEGLAYAHASQPLYKLLKETGVLDAILPLNHKGRYAREKLVQRIILGYLWEEEELDSPRFAYLFGPDRSKDLEDASTFLWMTSKQDLTANQVERIKKFWERCMEWSARVAEPPASLLSNLSRLAVLLDSIGARELPWLLQIAPHVRVNHNADHFIEELERLAEASPGEVGAVLNKVLDTYSPTYDFDDRLKKLLTKLAVHGNKAEAIALAERLRRHLPGMLQVYKDLSP